MALGTLAGWLERCVNKVLDGVQGVCVAQIKGGGILFDACGKSKLPPLVVLWPMGGRLAFDQLNAITAHYSPPGRKEMLSYASLGRVQQVFEIHVILFYFL